MEDSIEIRLRGEGIRPGFVRSHELAEILEAVEALVIAESIRREPGLSKDEIIVGLYEIADESIGLRFRSTVAAVALPAFIAASSALASGSFEGLSSQSLKSFQVLSNFAKRHGAVAELKIKGDEQPIAEISADTVIPKETKISGLTEVFAKVLRVGGKVPKAMIELSNGGILYCDVPVDVAIKLGHRLYKRVIFSGLATWNAETLDIEEFSITDFDEFLGHGAAETLAKVSDYVTDAVLKNSDVESLVAFFRREDAE